MSVLRYFIFSIPGADFPYRGVDRLGPTWRDDRTSSSEYNRACDSLAEARSGFDSLDEARRLDRIFAMEGERTDLVAVEHPASNRRVLPAVGFDVTFFSHHSFLLAPIMFGSSHEEGDSIATVLESVDRAIRPRLNR